MLDPDTHLSDEDLLLLADGELAPGRVAHAREHLAACWECRTRRGELEHTIADFVHAHHASLDVRMPPAAGPRALLKARLAESVVNSRRNSLDRMLAFARSPRPWAYACATLLLAALGTWVGLSRIARESPRLAAPLRPELVPNRTLTPGVARAVKREEVCEERIQDNDPSSLIPASVQQQALREYGVAGSQANEYQLDYLIPTALGGTGDIRNLWPEPYSETVWNARAKDALENRLHDLVCGGQIDLPLAQREIATDWISAYKKYFNAEKPVPDASKLDGV